MQENHKFTKHAGIVSFGILLSRILGFVRDLLLAHYFSATTRGIFFAAWLVPNTLRLLLGEGALSSSFIPVFVRYLKSDKKKAWILSSIVINLLLFVTSLIVLIGIIFSPIISSIVAPGFIKLGLIPLMSKVLRFIFPYLIFICISAFIMGILNSLNRFGPPAISSSLLNISFIVFILFICPRLENPIFGLCIAVLVGGLLQVAVQIPTLLSEKLEYRPIISLSHPGVLEVGIKMLPAIIGFAVYQVNITIDTILASLIGPSAISNLYYANRLIDFPLALFGTAIGIVSLPSLSRFISDNDIKSAKETLNLSLRLVVTFVIPASIGLIVLGKEVIDLLFEHGEFSRNETNACYLALFFYSIGLIFFSWIKPVVSFFYAMGDTKTPLKVSIFCMILNIFLNLIFIKPLEEGGIALATSMSSWINFSILTIILKRRVGILGLEPILKTLIKTTVASILMGIFLFTLAKTGLNVLLVIIIGVIVYFLLGLGIKISELSFTVKSLLKFK
ncbi:TPA: murein biosynthesis integral membrane protein MurJ [bacterium]|nr:murein biosynthesis integral membrane protein MurJ [bacterium]